MAGPAARARRRDPQRRGGVLATTADTAADEPDGWSVVTSRAPTPREAVDLDLAWRLVRHVRSNAIVLVKDGALVGVGAGQMSRVDSARLAVEKAGPDRARGSVCASDAFFPFADGVEACLAGGCPAFIQPGGSVRDAEVVAAAEAGRARPWSPPASAISAIESDCTAQEVDDD